MADERVRALGRRFAETGDLEDEVALLRERARAGDLSPEHLHLAAFCEHPAAAAVALEVPLIQKVEDVAWVFHFTKPHTIQSWCKTLGCPREEVAPGEHRYDLARIYRWRLGRRVHEEPNASSADTPESRRVTFANYRLRCLALMDPAAPARAVIATLRRDRLAAAPGHDPSPALEPLEALVLRECPDARRWLVEHLRDPFARDLLTAWEHRKPRTRLNLLNALVGWRTRHDLTRQRAVPLEEYLEAIAGELIPWALGSGDPLAAGRHQG